MSHDRAAVAEVLAQLSEAWRAGRFDAMTQYLHPDVVVAAPGGLDSPIEGREACLESYRDFMERVRVTDYAEQTPWIGVWGETAAASYEWIIAWEDGEGAHGASGRDVVALAKTPEGWRVVSRLMIEQARTHGQTALM